jgi:uncharacterized protein YcfJ
MKTVAVASTLVVSALALASASWAQTPARSRVYESNAAPPLSDTDRGTVISVTPIVQQVAVPQRVCTDEPVVVRRQPSGAGALLGAIAGGAMGNAVGSGSGRAAATAIGVIGGAAVGNSIEAGGQDGQVQSRRLCTTEHRYEDRTTAYSVVYEYAGREYTTRMRQDPGRYVQVHVQALADDDEAGPPRSAPPLDAPRYAPRSRSAPAPSSSRPPPVYVEPPLYQRYPDTVYETYPAPVYYEPGYPQFGTGLVLGALIGYGVSHSSRQHWHGGRWGRGR